MHGRGISVGLVVAAAAVEKLTCMNIMCEKKLENVYKITRTH